MCGEGVVGNLTFPAAVMSVAAAEMAMGGRSKTMSSVAVEDGLHAALGEVLFKL